jgi:hypothetical protein
VNPTKYSPDTTLVLQSLIRPAPQYEISPFTEHSMQAKTLYNPARSHYPSDWIVLSFLSCFIIIAWVQFFYFKRMRQIYYAPLSQRFLNLLTREGNLFKERISIALTIIYLFTYSLFLSLIIREFIPGALTGFLDYQVFAFCSAALVLFWLLKLYVIRFLGTVFRTSSSTMDYLQNILVSIFITGLILLPLLILTLYLRSGILLYITLITICLLYVFRVMRGYFIGISLKKFSYLFLFVYLCTLEILPLLVILKGLFLLSKGF